jgi:hypothetical protein
MKARDTHIGDDLHLVTEAPRHPDCFGGNGQIRGPGRNYRDDPLPHHGHFLRSEPQQSADRVVDAFAKLGHHALARLGIDTCGEHVLTRLTQCGHNSNNLLGSLARRVDDLGNSLAQGSVRVDTRIRHILEGEASESLDGIVRRHLTISDGFEKLADLLAIQNRLHGLAPGQMQELPARSITLSEATSTCRHSALKEPESPTRSIPLGFAHNRIFRGRP